MSRVDELRRKASIGKRNRRQAQGEAKEFMLRPDKVKPGMEPQAKEVERVIRQQAAIVRQRGYTRQRAVQIAMYLHRDLIEQVCNA